LIMRPGGTLGGQGGKEKAARGPLSNERTKGKTLKVKREEYRRKV